MANPLKSFFSGLSDKERRLLYITCGIVCFTLFDRVVLSPISLQSSLYEDQIAAKTSMIKKNLLILEYKDRILPEDKRYRSFFADKNSTEEELIASFLSDVEKLAKKSQVSLTNINPVTSTEEKGYANYKLVIECDSSMDNLIYFLYGIGQTKQLIRVVSLELSPKKRENYQVKSKLAIVKMIVIPGRETKPHTGQAIEAKTVKASAGKGGGEKAQ